MHREEGGDQMEGGRRTRRPNQKVHRRDAHGFPKSKVMTNGLSQVTQRTQYLECVGACSGRDERRKGGIRGRRYADSMGELTDIPSRR